MVKKSKVLKIWSLKISKSNFYDCVIKEKRWRVMSMLSESLCINIYLPTTNNNSL